MRKMNVLLGVLSFMATSLLSAQISEVHFENENSVWYKTDSGQSATFTVNADENAIAEIKTKYDNLGSAVSYIIESDKSGIYQITMNFNAEIHKVYLYKMLLFIGCEFVHVSEKKMNMDAFLQYVSA